MAPWQQVNDALRQQTRQSQGRHPEPSAAIVDSQSVKTTEKGDTRLRSGQESDGAQASYRGGASGGCSRWGRHSAGAWGTGAPVSSAAADLGCWLEIVARNPGQRRFAMLPRHWVVERTFGAGSAAAFDQALRGAAGKQCGVDTDCDKPADAAPSGPKACFLDTLLTPASPTAAGFCRSAARNPNAGR